MPKVGELPNTLDKETVNHVAVQIVREHYESRRPVEIIRHFYFLTDAHWAQVKPVVEERMSRGARADARSVST